MCASLLLRLTSSDKSKRLPYATVGLLDADEKKVTPLLFPNRRPVETLQRLIEVWDEVAERLIPGYPEEAIEDVEILAPFRGRDILCVGKNYKAHAVWVQLQPGCRLC